MGWAARLHIGAKERAIRTAWHRYVALFVGPRLIAVAVGRLLLALLIAPFVWVAFLIGRLGRRP